MRRRFFSYLAVLCVAAGSSFGQTSFSNTNAIALSSTHGISSALDSSAITSTGLSGKIGKITVTLKNWTENTDGGGNLDRECFLAYTPTGSSTSYTYEFLAGFGNFLGLSNVTVTLDDTSSNGRAPFDGAVSSGTNTYQSDVPNNAAYSVDPTTGLASGNTNFAGPDGTATFGSVFNGLAANGTWTLYIYDHTTSDDAASIAGGWTVTLTTAVEDGTVTSLAPSTTETFEGTTVTFTAHVSDTTNSGSTVTAGSVVFKDLLTGTTLGTVPVSSGVAAQTASFSSEGSHTIQASYSDGSNTFGPSSMSAAVFIDHTTTDSSPTFCNAGSISINSTSGAGVTVPYPQHIFPTGLTGSLSGLTLTLNNLQNVFLWDLNVLLVGPSGNSKMVVLAGAGPSGSNVANGINLALSDFGSTTVPSSGVGNGPYLPTDSLASLTFGAGTPAGPYSLPQTEGSATFAATFGGESNPNGMWSVYIFDRAGGDVSTVGGTCLTFTTSAIAATTTSLMAMPANATVGQTVTFTATVTSSGSPVTGGTVTFKENGTTLQGATAVDGAGHVTFSTNSLTEGIHNVTALYSGVAGTYNVSSGSTTIEVDTATTVAGTVYCNPGGIITPTSGSSSPYPSRILVGNLPGTVRAVTVDVDTFTNTFPQEFKMLLVGPSATNLEFFEDAGASTTVSGLTLSFWDTASSYVPSALSSGTYKPTVNSETVGSPFPAPAPSAGSITFAGPVGTGTLAGSFATPNFNGNGYWSLFTVGAGGETGSIGKWCLTFSENPPILAVAKTHTGSFKQGDTNDVYTITVTNNGPGSTGGTLTLADTLPTGLTTAQIGQTSGGTGSDWTCVASTATCTRTTPMATGETDVIALEVGVGFTTAVGPNSITNSVTVSGSGAAPVQATDPTTVIAGTVQVTFSTSPAGLSYSVDGTNYTTSQTMTLTSGAQHTIATTSPQTSTGTQNVFSGWSDGGVLSHSITISGAVTAYTASFNTTYLLTTAAAPSADGTVTPPSGTYYAANSVVNLTATPNGGYNFVNWTGNVANANAASTTVTMNAPQTVTANFVINNTNVTINTAPTGLLVSVDGGAAQAAPVNATWQVGTQHTIATTSPQGSGGTQYTFTSWSDAGALSHTVTASNSTASYTATFSTTYLLTTAASPSADGTVSPVSGMYYAAGTVVPLIATPNTGYNFVNWTGSVGNTNNASTSVTMSAPQSVTANFVINNANVMIDTSPTGLLVSVDGGAARVAPVSVTWQVGTQHTIATTSPQGSAGTRYTFTSWSDAGALSHTVTASNSTSYTATFSTTYLLTTAAAPSADGTVSPASGTYYAAGTVVPLVATPHTGYNFANWTGTVAAPSSASTSVTMSAPRTVTANFTINNSNVMIGTAPTGLLVSVDGGAAQAAPVNATWQVGTHHTIATTSPQGSAGISFVFANWSDGGSLAHTVTASNSVTSYTAAFNTLYFLTTSASPGAGGTVTPPSGYYAPASVVNLTATPNPGYLFANWTGSVANANSASTTVTMSGPQTVTANFTGPSAVYVPLDTTTQGNWVGTYGPDGYVIANDASSVPAYATVSFNGASTYTWVQSSTDPRALLKNLSTSDRIASSYYSATNFAIDVNLMDSATHQVALYLLDLDTFSRNETISILDANTNSVLDTRTFSNFHGGEYAVWNLTGHVLIQVTSNAGLNAVVSGLFFATVTPPAGPSVSITAPTANQPISGNFTFKANATAPTGVASVQFVLDNVNFGAPVSGAGPSYSLPVATATLSGGAHSLKAIATDNLAQMTTSGSVPFTVSNPGVPPASAVFVPPPDATTQGSWVNTYGEDGYLIANDATSLPVYATVNFTGATTYTWTTSSTAARALLKSPSSSDRIASAYYANDSFTIDVNLVDNQPHQVALYCLDFDDNRVETISILDANTNAVLDTQTASSFQHGKYFVWNMQGHVLVRVTHTGGLNAVVSALFFATVPPSPPPGPVVSVTAPTASQTVAGNFTLTATATSSGSTIASVQFVLDGTTNIGPLLTSGSANVYSYQWPSTTVANGLHTLTAIATDNLSQKTTSAPVSLSVANAPQTNSATFVTTDTTTHGNWKGKYGSDGEIIANDSNAPPAYSVVGITGAGQFTWATTTDTRALLMASSTTDRIASAFYNSPGFSIDVNFTDGQTHQIALYLLDWDTAGRAETISILDASNNNSLDSRPASGFQNGNYLVWNVEGHVIIQAASTDGASAVVSGVFFAPGS
jgi:hypothetical protein